MPVSQVTQAARQRLRDCVGEFTEPCAEADWAVAKALPRLSDQRLPMRTIRAVHSAQALPPPPARKAKRPSGSTSADQGSPSS
jgi:hypothetical protein